MFKVVFKKAATNGEKTMFLVLLLKNAEGGDTMPCLYLESCPSIPYYACTSPCVTRI